MGGVKTSVNIENWKCGKMRAPYKILITVNGRNVSSQVKAPITLETLFDTFEYGFANLDVRQWSGQ